MILIYGMHTPIRPPSQTTTTTTHRNHAHPPKMRTWPDHAARDLWWTRACVCVPLRVGVCFDCTRTSFCRSSSVSVMRPYRRELCRAVQTNAAAVATAATVARKEKPLTFKILTQSISITNARTRACSPFLVGGAMRWWWWWATCDEKVSYFYKLPSYAVAGSMSRHVYMFYAEHTEMRHALNGVFHRVRTALEMCVFYAYACGGVVNSAWPRVAVMFRQCFSLPMRMCAVRLVYLCWHVFACARALSQLCKVVFV